jgi:hypothetical protein
VRARFNSKPLRVPGAAQRERKGVYSVSREDGRLRPFVFAGYGGALQTRDLTEGGLRNDPRKSGLPDLRVLSADLG